MRLPTDELRIVQMKIVERAVRPVRASVAHKRRMREELLAHLETIYSEQLARTNDPPAALDEAARRFGDPIQLSHDLDRAVPLDERLGYHVDRYFAWRAPESVVRYSFRLARRSSFIFALVFLILPVSFYFAQFPLHSMSNGFRLSTLALGWYAWLYVALRGPAEFVLVMSIAVFLLFFLYYKIRDAIFGVFGSPKSATRVVLFSLISGLVVLAAFVSVSVFVHLFLPTVLTPLAFSRITEAKIYGSVHEVFSAAVLAATCTSFLFPIVAWRRGPIEIQDTLWSCLDI